MNEKNRVVGFYGGFFDKTGVGKTTAANVLVDKFDFHLCNMTSNVENFAKKIAKWDGKKDTDGIKTINHVCRFGRHIHPNYWLNLSLMSLPSKRERVVFDDVWFEEDQKVIKDVGGIFVLIERNGFEQPKWKFDPDFKISNDGNINDFEKKVCDFVQKIL